MVPPRAEDTMISPVIELCSDLSNWLSIIEFKVG